MKAACGMDHDERRGCEFYFPAGPWDDDCMHRDPKDAMCGNDYARDGDINYHQKRREDG
jgi:hypothetical protein